jgi:hypothetical protein
MLEGNNVEHVAGILRPLLGLEFSGKAPAGVQTLENFKSPVCDAGLPSYIGYDKTGSLNAEGHSRTLRFYPTA